MSAANIVESGTKIIEVEQCLEKNSSRGARVLVLPYG